MKLEWWVVPAVLGFVAGALLLNVLVWKLTLRAFAALGGRRLPNLFIAVRQLAGPKSGFLSVIGLLSILGVSFSSCTLDTVLSVMGGFQEDLRRKIVGSNAHVAIEAEGGEGVEGADGLVRRIRAVPGVIGASPLVLGEALVKSSRTQNLAGVLVRGVDVRTVDSVTDLGGMLTGGARVTDLEDPVGRIQSLRAPPASGFGRRTSGSTGDGRSTTSATTGEAQPLEPTSRVAVPAPEVRSLKPEARSRPSGPPPRGIFIGAQLADSMNVEVGDELQLVAPMGDLGPTGPMPRSRPFVVAGVFDSGMYEYDSKHVYVTLPEAQRFFGAGDRVSQIAVRVAELDRAAAVAARLREAIPAGLRVQDWQSINRSLFAALKLEKVMMFVMLLLAVLVASFSIFSTLTLMVFEKSRQIALLKALGATDGAVRRIYRLQGALIGLAGAVTGSALGLCLCLLAKHVIPFPVPKEIFYLSRLPVSLSAAEFLAVAAAAVAISTLSTVYPSRIASRLLPADGLRYE